MFGDSKIEILKNASEVGKIGLESLGVAALKDEKKTEKEGGKEKKGENGEKERKEKEEKEEKKKPKCVVVAAIANRWMRCLFYEMKTPLTTAA